MKNAAAKRSISTQRLCTSLTPSNGKLLTSSGISAQCMAQATEAAMPIASQLILNGMICKGINLQFCCKKLFPAL